MPPIASTEILELRRNLATTWRSAAVEEDLREPIGVGEVAEGSGGGRKGSVDDA